MTVLKISQIKNIGKNPKGKGYSITFGDDRSIVLHKRRTIPALLTLIKYGEGCEGDLTKASNNLKELQQELAGKIPSDLIQESYSDANKPFSELWNEEGFTFITNPPGQTRNGSKKYVLDPADHEKLFFDVKKAERMPPGKSVQVELLKKQSNRCNLCNSVVKAAAQIDNNTFSRDRSRLVWDHRIPVEKGGDSEDGNYQALCFYCNKCKWQLCNICQLSEDGCSQCALAFPESSRIAKPTNEDISDRAPHHD